LTEAYRFHTPIRVRYNETDGQGHVNFAWYFNYFDVALIEYLRDLGYSYTDMLADGVDMLYIDAHSAYKSPAYFDEILRIHCRAGKIGNTSLRFDFQIFGEVDGRQVASGEIVVVIAGRDTYEKRLVPQRLREAVEAFEGDKI
jgi:acyl-CoA thioester hydrolase